MQQLTTLQAPIHKVTSSLWSDQSHLGPLVDMLLLERMLRSFSWLIRTNAWKEIFAFS